MKRIIKICLILLLCFSSVISMADDSVFSLIWMSDTQSMIYYEDYEGAYSSVIDWVISVKQKYNVEAVLHSGDIVEDGFLDKEWKEPEDGYIKLKNEGIQFFPIAGNHDLGNKKYLNWEWYLDRCFVKEFENDGIKVFQDGKCVSMEIEHNNVRFVFVGVGYHQAYENKECIEWIKEQFNGNCVGVILTHSFISPEDGYSEDAKILKDEVLNCCPNIKLVLCGHVEGSSYLTNEGVHFIRFNPQGRSGSKLGFIRILTFDTDAGSLKIASFSPISGLTEQQNEAYEDGNFMIDELYKVNTIG